MNTFDTANVYSNGESERLLGKALKQYKIPREEVVILTKVLPPLFDGTNLGSTDTGVLSGQEGRWNHHGHGSGCKRICQPAWPFSQGKPDCDIIRVY